MLSEGYDFSDLNEQNFYFDNTTNVVYFIGFEPKILSSTINPWFIPEEKIPGFEFLMYSRGAQRDYSVLQKVKQGCFDKLVANAMQRDILLKAQQNAEEHLKCLFDILIVDGVRDVVFSGNKFEFAYDLISKDSLINGEELVLIDSLMAEPDTSFIQHKSEFSEKIEKLPVSFSDTSGLKYSPELTGIYQILADGLITDHEDSLMNVSANQLFTDSSWQKYFDNYRF